MHKNMQTAVKSAASFSKPSVSLRLVRVAWALLFAFATACATEQQQQQPDMPKYSAICAVAKDENRYLAEWVHYHKCLGVGRIYLYDHNSSIPLTTGIEQYIEEGFVKVIPFTGDHVRWKADEGFADNLAKFSATIQGKAYQDCLQQYASQHAFIGFIDVDEFIVLYDTAISHIDDLLRRYAGYGGLSLYWVLLGSSGQKAPSTLPVTQSFLKCVPRSGKPNTQFKSFVNTAFQPVMYSPHRAMFGVNNSNSFLVDENLSRIPAGRNKVGSHNVAAIYHYVTKSQQEFEAKLRRGGGAGVTRSKAYIRILDVGCKETCLEAALQYSRMCALPLHEPTRAELARGREEQRLLLSHLDLLEARRSAIAV